MLTAEQTKRIEELLLKERESTLEAIRDFEGAREASLQESTGELTVYRFHPADLGTEMMEQEKQFLLASNEGRRLYAIDQALRRIYAEPESFGKCTRCGRDIAYERLEVVPWTTLCAECQRIVEEEGAATARA